jgi:hypothetical protein
VLRLKMLRGPSAPRFEFDSEEISDLAKHAIADSSHQLALRVKDPEAGLQWDRLIELKTCARKRDVFQVGDAPMNVPGFVLPQDIHHVRAQHPGFNTPFEHILLIGVHAAKNYERLRAKFALRHRKELPDRLYCQGTIFRAGILVSNPMMRQALVLLIVVLTFGILVPWYQGVAFLQPWTIAVYGCMSLLFVAPAAAGFWSANPGPMPVRTLLARLALLVGYGWGVAVLTLIAAVLTLNLVVRRGWFLPQSQALFAAVLVFSLTASSAMAVLSALLARRFSAVTAKGVLRALFLGTLMLIAFGSRLFPESWLIVIGDHTTRRAVTQLAWEGSLIALVAAALLFAGLLDMLQKHPAQSPG